MKGSQIEQKEKTVNCQTQTVVQNADAEGHMQTHDSAEYPRRHKPKKHRVKRWMVTMIIAAIITAIPLGIDRYVVWSTQDQIQTMDQMKGHKSDAILVLGAYVQEDGTLSPMLQDRMKVGIELFKAGVSERLLLSGDGNAEEYDETAAMKRYAMENGVPEEAIIRDDAGLSTYTSMYRAKQVGEYDSLVVVTQKYHLYRSLYAANRLGLDAVGVPADLQGYWNQLKRDIREILARNKDFFQCITLPEPSHATDPYLLPQGRN